jgi:hypothetical protein
MDEIYGISSLSDRFEHLWCEVSFPIKFYGKLSSQGTFFIDYHVFTTDENYRKSSIVV